MKRFKLETSIETFGEHDQIAIKYFVLKALIYYRDCFNIKRHKYVEASRKKLYYFEKKKITNPDDILKILIKKFLKYRDKSRKKRILKRKFNKIK